MPSTTLARGNAISTFYIAPSITPAAVAANTTAAQTFALPGLLTTDIISTAGYTANQTTGIFVVECDCLTANILTIQFGNITASSATPASGIYELQIVRAEGPLPTTAV
jgi:hypothetical protein